MQQILPSALNCPNCGAPLHPGSNSQLSLCLYCGSSVRVQPGMTDPLTIDSTLDEHELAELKQLLLDGAQAQAIQFYQQKTGSSDAETREAVSDLGRQISLDIIRSQNLSPYGAVMVVISAALLLASLGAAWLRLLHPVVALLLAAFAALELFFYAPAMRTTLRFLRAPVAQATTLKLAPVGIARLGRQKVHTMLALLEVQPEGGPAYVAEMLLPVRDQNLARAVPGAVFQVKYLPDERQSLIYFGKA